MQPFISIRAFYYAHLLDFAICQFVLSHLKQEERRFFPAGVSGGAAKTPKPCCFEQLQVILADHHYSSGYYYHYYVTEQVRQPTGSRLDAPLDQSSIVDRSSRPPSFLVVDEDARKKLFIHDAISNRSCPESALNGE